MEKSGISVIIREMSGKNLVERNCPKLSKNASIGFFSITYFVLYARILLTCVLVSNISSFVRSP